jgi:hypothetical protein
VQIEELATGDFIRRCHNLIMVGWSGSSSRSLGVNPFRVRAAYISFPAS